MATSGTTALTFTRDNIIQEALEQMGVIQPGQTPLAAHVTSLARTLNNMVKEWQTHGLHLPLVSRRYLFADTTKREYTLTATGDRWVSSYIRTTIATAGSATDLTIEVADATGISDTNVIGIYLDDGTMQWTTVNGAPAANVVTITAALTDDVSVGAVVYVYATTNRAARPLEIVEAFERSHDQHDIPLEVYSRQEYANQVLKEQTGNPVGVYYDPQVATPTLFVWPIITDPRTLLVFWAKRSIESFTAADNEVDLPQEAFMALAFNLAFWSLTKFQVPATAATLITQQAGLSFKSLEDYLTRPEGPLQFEVDSEMETDW